MAELATIARPYAEAAFTLAKQRGELAKWSEMLSFIVGVYQDPQFQAAIAAPTVTNADIERMMLAVCGDRIDGNASNFIQLLVGNARLPALAEMQKLFEALKSEDEGVVEARIASAYPLEDQQVQQIVAVLGLALKQYSMVWGEYPPDSMRAPGLRNEQIAVGVKSQPGRILDLGVHCLSAVAGPIPQSVADRGGDRSARIDPSHAVILLVRDVDVARFVDRDTGRVEKLG